MNKSIFVLVALFCISVIFSNEKPYEYKDYFQEISEPMHTNVKINPLDYCSQKIGQDMRDFPLPLGFRGQYRFGARFHLIDKISNQPLYMKTWAESNQLYFANNQEKQKLELAIYALELLTNSPDFVEFKSIKNSTEKSKFQDFLNESKFPKELQGSLSKLYSSLLDAHELTNIARSELDNDDIEFFKSNPGYYLTPDSKRIAPITGNVSTHFKFIEKARKVKYDNLFASADIVISSMQNFINEYEIYTQNSSVKLENINFPAKYNSPFGDIVFGSTNSDTFASDVAIIIDFGGNDVYLNNAGGYSDYLYSLSFVLDFEGNDKYLNEESNYVQGFGFLGTGIIADLSGDDIYKANHYCQGAAIMGIGILYDNAGNDSLFANTFCQGAGIFGLGMVINNHGDDIYDGASICQGGASCLGLGILTDLDGNDKYMLNAHAGKDPMGSAGYGQGGGLSFRNYPWRDHLTPYGGAGVLFDHNGNDDYHTKGWCDQGGSYIMSLGCLVDGNGDDNYIANTGQGSAIHITNAILIDKSGNDSYKGGFRSGASGSDHSPGILIDYSGNDKYSAGKACYGTGCKPWNLSLFIDYKGDDIYTTSNPKNGVKFNDWDSFGGVWPESTPYNWAYATFLDLNGADTYETRNKQNESETSSFGHGIFLDMTYNFDDIIGDVKDPYENYTFPTLPKMPDSHKVLIEGLTSKNNFSRFEAIGAINNFGDEIMPSLISCLMISGQENRLFNRNIMECIDNFIIQKSIDSSYDLEKLLEAPDEEVRLLIADDFGFWKLSGGETLLLKAAQHDKSHFVRQNAMRALIRLEYDKAFSLVYNFAINDPDPGVRRLAVAYFNNLDIEFTNQQLLDFYSTIIQQDSSSQVRIAAIDGIAKHQLEDGIDLLFEMSEHFDYYIKRASGMAIAELCNIEGINILIESLVYPSIDAFENYNRNVPNAIAKFTGYDFPEDQRYNIEIWRNWFRENKNNIDLKRNLMLKRDFEHTQSEIQKTDNLAEIAELYESYISKYPENDNAKKEFATFLNKHAWNMVTADKSSEEFNPVTGLNFAKRAVELSDDLNFIDTLAEAYLASDDYENSTRICKEHEKEHSMFKDRLKRIESELNSAQ